MYFTTQQLQGGPRFQHGTRIGNWVEDREQEEIKLKDYMSKKEKGQLCVNNTEAKFAKSLKRVPQTYSESGQLKIGDHIMLLNKQNNGFLVMDLGEKITSLDEAYGVTTTNKEIGPCARSVFVIAKADPNDENKDDLLHFGQKIRILSNPAILDRDLYLHSCQVSPVSYARFSRNQEVCMNAACIHNTVWEVEALDPNARFETAGRTVNSHEPILLKHCATNRFLSSDLINYRNDFGMEFEVSVHSHATKNRSQNLALEKNGKIT